MASARERQVGRLGTWVGGLGAGLSFSARAAPPVPAQNTLHRALPPRPQPAPRRPDSCFGINPAFGPDTVDLTARLKAMQQAGIKWGRQDFTWKRIETRNGHYEWDPYDQLVEECRRQGVLLFGDL